MPGTNLTREEARTRAGLLGDVSYTIDLDLTSAPSGSPTFASTTTLRFSAQPGASTFADLIAATVHEITLNGRSLDPATAYDGSRIALDGLAEHNELTVVADCVYSRTGEGLHRSIDPSDKETYLYTQFEVPDARRVFTTFEQPDLKAPFTFTVSAPARWAVISNAPTPEPTPYKGENGEELARWEFGPTKPISTYIPAVVAGPYHVIPDAYEDEHGSYPMALLCRPSLASALDADDLFTVTKQGFALFEKAFGIPYPFEKYDQAFVPEYNMGAMENAGCVTLRDDLLFRSRTTASELESRANTVLHELAHMWFGDLVTMTWWDELGVPAGPAAVDAPDRRGHDRLPRGRGELRRHHLRQGRLRAAAAGRLRRRGGVRRRAEGVLRRPRVQQHRADRPAQPAGEGVRPGSGRLDRALAAHLRGEHAARGLHGRRRRRVQLVRDRADRGRRVPDAAAAPARGRALQPHRRGAGPDRPRRGGRRRPAHRARRARRRHPAGPDPAERRRPDLREDPAGRAVPADADRVDRPDPGLAAAGTVLGRRVGHDPGRRDARRPVRRAGAARGRRRDRPHRRALAADAGRQRDQRVRRTGAPARTARRLRGAAGGAGLGGRAG